MTPDGRRMVKEEALDTHSTDMMGTQIKKATVTAKTALPSVHTACSTKLVSETVSSTMGRIVCTVLVHHTTSRAMSAVKATKITEQILAAATTRQRTAEHLPGRSGHSGVALGDPVRNRIGVGMTTVTIIGVTNPIPPNPHGHTGELRAEVRATTKPVTTAARPTLSWTEQQRP